ncbi:MAG: hypothetical protein ACOX4A_02155 [Saccharofermentanales bacterium]|jgi:hypothetical protein
MKLISKTEIASQVNGFCKSKGYSLDMLLNLRYWAGYPESAYVIPSKVEPDGLMNDIATQPTPILFVVKEKDGYGIVETEYTVPYFKRELEL